MTTRLNAALRALLVLTLLAGALVIIAPPTPSGAAVPGQFFEYFIDGEEQQLFDIFEDNDNDPVLVAGSGMHAVVGVTSSTDGVTVYYDHWEDGYDWNPLDPLATADEIVALDEGEHHVFESSNIPLPRTAGSTCGGSFCYDGRDRVIATEPVAVTRATWPQSIGTVFSLAWEVLPTNYLGKDFLVPGGEDLDAGSGYNDFDNTYVVVQAVSDGTQVVIDDPLVPGVQQTVTLDMGETTEQYNVNTATTISGSKPVQVQMFIGDANAGTNSEFRAFTLIQTSDWTNDYFSPVADLFDVASTDVYVFNPSASAALTVSYEDTSGSGTFSVPARGVVSYSDGAGRYVPTDSGVHISAANPFYALSSVDTERAVFDWGFSLIPTGLLGTSYYVGWAPGGSPTSQNCSPIWVTPVNNSTTVNIDWDADGTVDQSVVMNRLQSRKFLDASDNDQSGAVITSTGGPIAITFGEDSLNSTGSPCIDLGYTILPIQEILPTTAHIGDRIWNDLDGDGVQDPGEPGINGVTVNLLDSGGAVVATVVTSLDGDYLFFDNVPGTYTVQVDTTTLPAGMVGTYDPDGPIDNEYTVTVIAGDWIENADFGYVQPGSIGDFVFTDIDEDGVYDAGDGDAGQDGVTVELYEDTDGNGTYETLVATQVTSGGGAYDFTGILPGDYQVKVDSAALTTPGTHDVTMTGGLDYDLADFGLAVPGSIGDLVFTDLDGDGVFEPGDGEAGIGGVTVDLYLDSDGNGSYETFVATQVTDGSGSYDFTGLRAGDYRVDVDETSAPVLVMALTTPDPVDVTLAPGGDENDADFGFITAASIGDFVWEDLDADGSYDPGDGEAGIDGVTIDLYRDVDGDGTYETFVATTVTAGGGAYLFTGLSPGDYSARADSATAPPGYVSTTTDFANIELDAAEQFLTADFGYRFAGGSIGDLVFSDEDFDGVPDLGEPGINGVTVELYQDTDGNGSYETLVATQVTSGGGAYQFTGLPPGDYRVDVDEASAPLAGLSNTTTVPVDLTLTQGEVRSDIDFGYAAPASIGDRVWDDTDGDGVQDGGESGLNGVTVELYQDTDGNGSYETLVATQVTSGDGDYGFTGLAPGEYRATVDETTLPAGYAATTPVSMDAALTVGADVGYADFGFRQPQASGQITKEAGTAGPVSPGETVTYTVTITNDSGATWTGVDLDDVIPNGTTFVSGSTSVAADRTLLDVFAARTYDGNDGSASFPADWVEVGESDGPTNGDVKVENSGGIWSSIYLLIDKDGSPRGLDRLGGDLSGWASGVLSFDYGRKDIGKGGDDRQLYVQVRPTGSAGFTTVMCINSEGAFSGATCAATTGETDDAVPQSASIDISALLGTATTVRFVTNGIDQGQFSLDNISIRGFAATVAAEPTLLDVFAARTYDGNDGSASFPADWVEVGESDGPTNGDVKVENSGGIWSSIYLLIDKDGSPRGLDRLGGDLSGWASGVLSFDYGRKDIGKGGDDRQLYVQVRPTGSAGFTTVMCINSEGAFSGATCAATTGETDDAVPQSASIDISALLGTATTVRFVTNGIDQGQFSLDNISIAGTVPLGDAPDLADGYSLLNGERLVATFEVTVDDPSAERAITNTASFTTDQQPTPTSADVTLPLVSGSIGDFVWNDENGDGVQDAGEDGLGDVTLELWEDTDGNGSYETLVATTVTDTNGGYVFTSVPAGDYRVELDPATLPVTFALTTAGTVDTALGAGRAFTTADFGARGSLDFGDAPNSYGTKRASNGARHVIGGPSFGIGPDSEGNAAAAAAGGPATGDDTSGIDDEDGITLPPLDGATSATIVLNVSAASWANGWIDFDNNGVFDAGESIFDPAVYVSSSAGITSAGRVLAAGNHTVTVNVPDFALNGSGFAVGDRVYARFRVAAAAADVAAPTGLAASGEVEDHDSPVNTLPVDLSFVLVDRRGDEVTFTWQTANEFDNLGFALHGELAGGDLVELSGPLVLSKGPNGAEAQEYSWSTTPGRPFEAYWIEDVSLGGLTRMHGPYSLGVAVGRPRLGAESEVPEMNGPGDVPARATEAAVIDVAGLVRSGDPVARLSVTETGVHSVTYEDLTAIGVDLAGFRRDKLALVHDREPVAMRVRGPRRIGPGTSFEYYGVAPDSLYSDAAIYHVHIDKRRARRAERGDTRQGDVVRRVVMTETVDEEHGYSVAAPGDDPWFNRNLISVGNPTTVGFPIELDAPVAGRRARLEVVLWGVTHYPDPDEHHVQLVVNGSKVSDFTFDGQGEHRARATLDAGLLRAGNNTVRVTVVGDTGVPVDIVAVDSYSIRFSSELAVPADGQLRFRSQGNRFAANGLAQRDVRAYRIDSDGGLVLLPVSVGAAGDGSYTALFPGAGRAATYVVAGASDLLRPGIEPGRARGVLPASGVDYLIISHNAFIDQLGPLVAFHEGRGLRVGVADVADVYDRLGSGAVDAAVIDRYIRKVAARGDLEYVLLVGGDTFDYLDHTGKGRVSYLPSPYGPTGQGVTFAPIDQAYADIDADKTPDIALGRFPVTSAAEAATVVEKTLAYADPRTHRVRSAVLASDLADNVDYAEINDDLASALSKWSVTRADLDHLSVDAARGRLFRELEEGVAVTSFVGHSGASDWSTEGLLSTSDVNGLTSDAPTLVTQFGCWNAYYVEPGGLGADLLHHDGGGAAAVMGATTLTSASADATFAGLLMGEIDREPTIGAAVLRAKDRLANRSAGNLPIQLGWTLLGDPGLPLPGYG